MENLPSELQALSFFVHDKPEVLISENSELRQTALDATKFLFDLCPLNHNAFSPNGTF